MENTKHHVCTGMKITTKGKKKKAEFSGDKKKGGANRDARQIPQLHQLSIL